MADLQGFDANKVEPRTAMDPIPAGRYLAVLSNSEMKANKAGTGQFLELVFTIIEGELKNRQLWARLNLVNPNQVATKIAQAELSALCRAVNVLTPRDSVELHNLPLTLRVRLKRRADTQELVNVVSGFEPRDAVTGRPQQAQTNTPPWRR
jgi:hypothetical protein